MRSGPASRPWACFSKTLRPGGPGGSADGGRGRSGPAARAAGGARGAAGRPAGVPRAGGRRRGAAGLSPAVARASAGALAHCLVAQAGNLVAALGHLKAQGVWVVGADPAGGERYDEVSLAPPVALVVGGEGRGLHRLVRERCDRVVRIPLRGVVASLNVSVAAALLLFEVARHLPAAAAGGGARAGARPGAAPARPARES